MQLIGVAGVAGSGKNTVADYLTEHYGYEQVSFAAILKKMLAVAGCPEPSNRDLKEANIEGFNFSWRHMAQTLGSEWGRDCLHPDIWVLLTMRGLRPDGKYVVSDCRFQNEADAIINAGGSMVHLYGRSVELGNLANHVSEKPLIPSAFAHKVWNDKPVEHLYAALRGIVESLQWQDGLNAK